MRRVILASALLSLFLAGCACDEMPPSGHDLLDAGPADGPEAEASGDGFVDTLDGQPDAPVIDWNLLPPDSGPDSEVPDLAMDLPLPDTALPDASFEGVVDQGPDLLAPDSSSLCGDGVITPPEQCDGAKLGGKSCTSLGYSSGTLKCSTTCTLDTSGCTNCGNGKVDPGELCDGSNFGTNTCKTLGFDGGKLACVACALNTSGCHKCGDNKVNGMEQCDGKDLGGKSCTSLGYSSGTLMCSPNCLLDASGCVNCGNGKIDSGEACDGKDLGGKTCKSAGFDGGTLTCKNCALDTAGCHKCGDGKIAGGEQCDGLNLGGKTCQSQGYAFGNLKCKACKLDTSGCTNCGNKKLDSGEQCDGALLGGKTCKAAGFQGGTLKCSACKLNTSGCHQCGNAKVDMGEQCDGANIGGMTCKSAGFDYGTLTCKPDCKLDTSSCKTYGCGDGKVTGSEQCDGANLNGKTCKLIAYEGGTLKCLGNCKFDKSGCYKCGDGKINSVTEQCDSFQLGGKTCTSMGYFTGILMCDSKCKLDTSYCTNCGNNKLDTGEQCDSTQFGGKTCKTQGFHSGTLTCSNKCKIITVGCTKCGDGTIDSGEQCDGANLGGKTCKSLFYSGGTLKCSSSCSLDTSGCTKCGDGVINTGEECDGTQFGGKTCSGFGYHSGFLACTKQCKIDKSYCTNCGNHKLDPGEQCDNNQFGGKTCKSMGYYTGTLVCTSACKLSTAGCTNCGNGKMDTGEQCDKADLGGKTCKSLGNYVGTLTCNSNCKLNTSGCKKCGNGVIDYGEQCDGTNLGGKTCTTLGFDGGTAACLSTCTFDTSKCYKIKLLVDDTHADFNKGELSGAGAKALVAAKGNVQLLDRLDLNGDGYLDLTFGNHFNGVTSKINSYIYWNSAAGYSSSSRTDLPTIGAAGTSAADLNGDGYLDLVFSNSMDTKLMTNTYVYHNYKVNSYVYWGAKVGSTTGFSPNNKTELPTLGSTGHSVADLNRDGYLDIVFSNGFDGSSGKINSYIYWGSSSGFSVTNRGELPTLGTDGLSHAPRNVIADLNGDGYLDIVFANHTDGSTYKVNSYIYWGSSSGFSKSSRAELPTSGASGCSVADLNGDGNLDIVFSNHTDGSTHKIDSYAYWGSKSGFSASNRVSLPTIGAAGNSVADLDGDGYLDIVFSNHREGKTKKLDSYIYWGSASGYSVSKRTSLPTSGATGNVVADLDGDGDLDIAFVSQDDGSSWAVSSVIYWGSTSGFSSSNKKGLSTVGGAGVTMSSDPGNVFDRKGEHEFTSRVHDAQIANPKFVTLTLTMTQPKNTSIKVQVRSGSTTAAVSGATWYGPSSAGGYYTAASTALNSVHNGNRYIQYRAVMTNDFGNTPVLDKVTLSYHK